MGSATTKKSDLYTPELADTIPDNGRANKGGRPPFYTPELAEEVLRRMAEGQSVLAIGKTADMPSRDVIIKWLTDDTNGFADKYKRAKESMADVYIEQTIGIVDKARVDIEELKDPRLSSATAKIVDAQVRARQWTAARSHPAHWGDKSQVDVSALVSVLAPADIKKPRTSGLGKTQEAQAALPEGNKPE